MNLKVGSACIFYLACSFLISKTKTEFRHEEHEWTKVKNIAVWVSGLLEANKELIRNAPKTYSFIRSLATDVTSFVATVNPANAAATVYFTGVVAISYLYSVEAQQQLQKARFKIDELQMIINNEILPIIGFLERLHSGEDMRRFCQAKTEIGDLFGNALTSLQTIRKDIEQQMIDSTSGAEKNRLLQWLNAAVAIGSTAAIATAPCLSTGLLACPQAMAGSSAFLSNIWGFVNLRNNKLTHEETIALLNVSRIEALSVEGVLLKARVNVKMMCIGYPSFPEQQLDSLAIYMPKEHRPQFSALPGRSDL